MDDFDIIRRALEKLRDPRAAIEAMRRIEDELRTAKGRARKAKAALQGPSSRNRGCG